MNFYCQAIKLRKELSSVKYGSNKEYNCISNKIYMYSREEKKEIILVICSFSDKNVKVKVPNKFDLSEAELILNNYDEVNSITFKPYETRVYKWNK